MPTSPYPPRAARLSTRVRQLAPSPIREILSVIDRPGMISFAGGLPATETFPRIDLSAMPVDTLQYGASEGDTALRERVVSELNSLGFQCASEQVLILSGSQQGIDLVAKLFIDDGTQVAVESPTYLAALQVFRFFGARFASFSPDSLTGGFGGGARPAFAYAIPTFQNPTGHCYNAQQRSTLAAACDEANVPMFEDDPYRDLVYDACERTPVCTRLRRAPWIYQGSFSKSLAPGLRLGYLAASPDLIPQLTQLKQAADLHSNRVSQWVVLQQLNAVTRADRMASLVKVYRDKRDAFERALQAHFSDLATWQSPSGGLFFWLQFKHRVDTRTLLSRAIEQGVAFMPGEAFYASESPQLGTMRLNFSHASTAQIDSGLRTLADLVRQTH